MKTLPYFRWYPSDAETDLTYASLSLSEKGLFHVCLNMSWINDGLPGDAEELRRSLRLGADEFNSAWPRVSKCFVLVEGKLTNKRQEEEREYACSKSVKASESRSKRERTTNVERTLNERTTDEPLRAYVSVSESEVSSKEKTKALIRQMPKSATDGSFDEVVKDWKQLAAPDQAAQMWVSVVNADNLPVVLACVTRYKASQQWAEGKVMELWKWLQQQHSANWGGQWPPARASPVTSMQRRQSAWDEVLPL